MHLIDINYLTVVYLSIPNIENILTLMNNVFVPNIVSYLTDFDYSNRVNKRDDHGNGDRPSGNKNSKTLSHAWKNKCPRFNDNDRNVLILTRFSGFFKKINN